ncbi:MAG: L-histidine N(alpha)-methyltransferase [Gemmatimonadales bacterium]|nr:L-histidine N(alpha)-methyltransferase [Gemmatimonadales bacterium]NIN10801.1 L-histidine N(alpha)-methyltransferase [Gemmatimonadales bacterium]NIN49445.1 L-histidine N(alpha)-methyltransferase [Gemmatimonadales bacterium]NIP06909.1 L-histidine N(alpha)-methyltransferase [Gemmatimonadales bacterium]NIR02845.1 L-histidine N(alpha)-methyltransferase [Gemmatimonadales bacterium]
MSEFARAAAIGLTDTPRWLPCRYLYDAEGSALFDKITEQPEYYPTRTEAAILERAATEIRGATGPVTLIELGSGSSIKTSYLLSAYTGANGTVSYVPVDVSHAALRSAGERIAEEHPQVDVVGIHGRYEDAFPLLRQHSPCMVLFLGSTVGNFNHVESLVFWQRLARHLPRDDYVLLGVDLVKDKSVLEKAYNDAAGVTRAFTKNLLARMNRELGSGIDLDQVEHVALYSEAWQRVEVYVRFRTAQTVHIKPLATTVEIGAGERVMTEISRKFVLDDVTKYLSHFGLHVRRVYTDDRHWFGVLLLQRS